MIQGRFSRIRLEAKIMKTANKAPKPSDRKRQAPAMRILKVKPLEASKVRGGSLSKIGDIKGESKDDKHGGEITLTRY